MGLGAWLLSISLTEDAAICCRVRHPFDDAGTVSKACKHLISKKPKGED